LSVENTNRTTAICFKKTPCKYRYPGRWQQCRHCFYYGFPPTAQKGFTVLEVIIIIGIIMIIGTVGLSLSHQESALEAIPTTTIIEPIRTPVTLTPGHNYIIVPTEDQVY
jgi:ribosomal protein L40E